MTRRLAPLAMALIPVFSGTMATQTASERVRVPPMQWPQVTRECRPWSYWWWMGSAVDAKNLTQQLELYSRAGLGGVHVIPIYGARGYEDRYIEYLSPEWMAMLRHAVAEARRLGMGVDMTAGTGWCYGGPQITDALANARMQHRKYELTSGDPADVSVPPSCQALVAYGPDDRIVELTDRIGADGRLDWTVPDGAWTLYAVWQKPSGRQVKRAAPGGAGHMLNPFYGRAIRHYLQRFDKAFAGYDGPMPRAIYHDSYEYVCDWSPDLFAEFEKRRGYRLQTVLPLLLGEGDRDRVARVKGDYRRTVSDMMTDNFTRTWVQWARDKGCRTRNQAHGSPGNLLDLYATADIPETEFFRLDRDPLVAKFASSAAHVAGRNRVASETGTWLAEHFHVTLGHLKSLIDGLFVSGVNHVIYHGTCYSPDDAPWPGWLFYASTQMNPRNAIWHDAPALNAYIARCQSILQAGRSDNDVLLYWPIHDLCHDPRGLARTLTVHHTAWLRDQPIGRTAATLWKRGFPFDYVSDRRLQHATAADGAVRTPGGTYRAVLVPPCRRMPVDTAKALRDLAAGGATVVFESRLPDDVPGLGRLEARRRTLRALFADLQWKTADADAPTSRAAVGEGRVLVGADVEKLLQAAGVVRESMVDYPGLVFVRRDHGAGRDYFIVNTDDQFTRDPEVPEVNGWIPLATTARFAVVMDPMTGKTGAAAVRRNAQDRPEVYLQLQPGQSLVVRTYRNRQIAGLPWPYRVQDGAPLAIEGTWKVEFLHGGPQLPASFETAELASWTERGEEAKRFAGTARYSIIFDPPTGRADGWRLDLGQVAESARVRLNGRDFGTVFSRPFQVDLPSGALEPTGNRLEIDVTNLSANRIRDLDRRGVKWRIFHNINFVNIDYKAFDASDWPVRDSGLLGPVRLIPLKADFPQE